MNENHARFICITICISIVLAILIIVAGVCYYNKSYIDAGFTQEALPGVQGTTWVKKDVKLPEQNK